MNKKILFSVFNTVLKSYSSKLVRLNNTKSYFNINIVGTNIKLYNVVSTKYIPFSTEPVNDIVTYDELKQICEAKCKEILIIDVREPDELQDTGVLPGSINIPLGEVENVLKTTSEDEFLSKYGRNKPSEDAPIIFSCRSGRRSGDAQAISRQLGYKNVRNYIGGWLEWEEKHIKS